MEATYNEFSKEDIIDSIRSKSESAISNCQAFLKPKSKNTMSNTEIVIWINELHKCLDDEHEAGVKIQHLGKEIVFYIDHIAHQNKSMIYFKGQTEKGKLVHFVKPPTDLKIELEALKRRSPNIAKSPFGFADWDAFEEVKCLSS